MTSPSDYIKTSSRDYSIYVCENRAIPKVSDGLKTGQRIALWLLKNQTEKIKVISLAGTMLSSNLYTHGDTSASATVGLMAAPYLNNHCLVEGIGAFGSKVAPHGIGAPRYTYCRRSKVAQELLYKDLDVIPTKENYDGSAIEPVTFLPLIPLVLLNGISGIAVGWSTEILPRSLNDLINATVDALEGKKVKRLVPTYSYLNCKGKHVVDNTWEFFGKLDIVDSRTVRITELPPDLSLEKFKDRLDSYEEDGKINTYTDNSTKEINIDVIFKRGTLKDWSKEKLIDFFKLKSKKTERIVVVDWNGDSIKQYENAEQVVVDFVEWRFGYYVKRYEKMLDDDTTELRFWKGVKACFDDNLPAKLTGAKNKQNVEEMVTKITKSLELTPDQIDKIASFASYRWAKDNYQVVKNKIKELESNIKQYKKMLKDQSLIRDVFKEEVEALKSVKFDK